MIGSQLEKSKVELEFDGFNLKDFKLVPKEEGGYVWNDDCPSGVKLISMEELDVIKEDILFQLKYRMQNSQFSTTNRILSGEDSYSDRMIASYKIERGVVTDIKIFNNFTEDNQLINFIRILYEPDRIYYWLNMFYDD
jgi:hypothetical protein